MKELPPGWVETHLDAIVEILDSERIPINAAERETRILGKKADQLFPYYGATGRVGEIDDFLFDEPLVLLGEDGVPFFDPIRQKAYLVEGKCWVNNHAHVLRPIQDVTDRRYLNAYLNAFDYTGYITGSTRLKLTQGSMRSIPIHLAPIREQKRIADKLDKILARVTACRDRLDRIPVILKCFRQSVLCAATSGELTAEWREAKRFTFGWETVPLGNVAREFSYGTSKKSERAGSMPVLRMGNIQDGRIDWSDLVYTSDSTEIEKYSLSAGDVLFNRTNSPGLVGKTAIYNGEREAVYAGYLIRIRCGSRLLPDYLNYCLNSPAGRDYCWRVKSDGVSQSNINAKKLAAFQLNLPTVEEQQEIVHRVKTLFYYADRLKASYAACCAKVEGLTPALLAESFRGELVPQDPNDEPASALLARIFSSRTGTPDKLKQIKKRRKIVMPKPTSDSVKAIIQQMPNNHFTFDELHTLAGSDYETLKDVVFSLLSGTKPFLRQVFDGDAQTMRFERIQL